MAPEERTTPLAYLVSRERPASETEPPWVGLSYTLRVGSDQLSDQLKHVYPTLNSLRQRKHKAAIDFLLKELHSFRAEDSEQASSIPNADWQSVGTPRSDSKETVRLVRDSSTSQSLYSPSPSVSMSPRTANAMSLNANQNSPLPLRPSSPNPAGKHFVFSATDGRAMQPKTKRKMTKDERKDYKKTRERGACDLCRKKKGKCTHTGEQEFQTQDTHHPGQGVKRRKSGHDRSPSIITKLPKTEEPTDVLFQSPERSQSVTWFSQSQQSAVKASNSSSNSATPLPTDGTSHINPSWSHETGLGDQSGQMYVSPSQASSGMSGIPLPNGHISGWGPIPEDGTGQFNTGYTEGRSSPTTRSFIPSFNRPQFHFQFSPNSDFMDPRFFNTGPT